MAPRLVTVASRHGLDTFRSAAGVPDRDLADAILAYLFLFLLTAPAIGVFDLLGQVRHALAHVRDAERGEKARQRGAFGALEVLEQSAGAEVRPGSGGGDA